MIEREMTTLRRAVNGISAALSVLMIGITLVVGWYQAVQIIDFVPSDFNNRGDKWCQFDTSNLCAVWPDRLGLIAMGVIVPILLGPFVLIYMNTVRHPWPLKKRLIVWSSIVVASFLVYLSGLIIYAIL